jgi:predicted MFS family arabinose efflux permease
VKAPPPPSLAWTVWGLGAALYLIAFYQRVAPAVITAELSRDFALSAASLGNLSAFYFYGYVAVQIPTGLLADRWGPRRVLFAGAALTALGTLVFALAPSLSYANAGRLAIGAAAGVAFVAMMKLATHWMPARQFAFATALALFIGTLGATLAGAPLRVAVDAFGWRAVMATSAVFTAAVAVAVWTVVRDDPSQRGFASYFATDSRGGGAPSIASQLRDVFRYRTTWAMLVIPGAFSGIVLTFAGLWGVPFLIQQYGFGPRAAAVAASAMLVSWALGGLAFAAISQRLGRRKPAIAAGLAASAAFWSLVVFIPALPRPALVALLMATAFATGAAMLSFPLAKESVPPRLAGTVGGIANMGMMLGGMLMQPLVGWVLDRNWSGAIANGVRAYDFEAWQRGFALMLAWVAAASVALAFVREGRAGTAANR